MRHEHVRLKRLIQRVFLFISGLLLLWYLLWERPNSKRRIREREKLNQVPDPGTVEKGLVIAKMRKEDVAWAYELQPDWTPYIYTASQPPEPGYPLIPPGYRGREAVTYLTFIIDHYEALPAYTAFVHANPNQWHNDLLGEYATPLLQSLRLDTIRKRGYVNLRCKHDPGCPIAVVPFEPTKIDIRGKDIRAYFADVYMELFDVPSSQVPEKVGNVCCGQFAVSRERIRERPRRDYERMRRWALESSVTNSFGVGWVFEKVWHVIFGMPAQYCPDPIQCRCELIGWCGAIPEDCPTYRRRVEAEDEESDELQSRKLGNSTVLSATYDL